VTQPEYPLDHRRGYVLIPHSMLEFDPLTRDAIATQTYIAIALVGPAPVARIARLTGRRPTEIHRAIRRLRRWGIVVGPPSRAVVADGGPA